MNEIEKTKPEDENLVVHKDKKIRVKKNEALWMLTFADLSFILMCFFALLLSMSKPNVKRFENVIQGISKTKTISKGEKKDAKNLQNVFESVKKEIKRKKLSKTASVKYDSDGVAIEFKDKMVFKPGSAQTSPNFKIVSRRVLDLIAKSSKDYRITIEGHTDDTPLGSRSRYKNNWELSSARGVSMLQLFKKKGINQSKMRVIAYADTKPKHSIAGKRGSALRAARAQNRRIVVRID